MRRIVAGVIALMSVSGVAAADGYRGRPAYAPAYLYNWSGVYFGSHIGGGWADVDLSEALIIAGPGITPLKESFSADGWLAGVHLGAMKQFGSFVTGVELNIDGADINGSASGCAGGPAAIVCESRINWMVTGLSRLGVAWDRWLAYGTVGYAVAGVDHSVSAPIGAFTISFDKQDVAHGIAFGGGLEFAVSKDLLIGVQYLHANLEARNEGLLLGGVVTNGRRDLDVDTVTARLSYKFGGECCVPGPLK
jgi:outer membrane immunogenic protein